MNRGQRAEITKRAKVSAREAERKAVQRLIQNHRHMMRAMLPDGEGKSHAIRFADQLLEQLSWAWHRENQS